MGSETEPAKTLLPYLQRADELQKHEPLVAYYCRLYAMEKGLKIPVKERTKTTNSILVSLMNQLEKDKKSLKLGPEDGLYVEGFASNVFAKADKQDRAGRADLNTAKTFYAASIFFEILYQFGELQPDIEQKQKYAVWKAADIRKALKDGRKPEPGPPGGDKDLSIPSTTSTNAFDITGQHPAVDVSHHVGTADLQHPENFPTSPSSSYPGPGFHPSDVHQPPVSRSTSDRPESSSAYPQQQHYQDQPYSSEHQSTHQNHPADGPPAPTNHHYPSEGGYPAPPPYSPQDKPVRSYSLGGGGDGGHPPNHPGYDAGAPHSFPPHETSSEGYPSHEAPPSGYTYANFQTYPSFNDSSLPAIPGGQHASSYYPSPPAPGYPPAVVQYTAAAAAPPSPPAAAAVYTYDSSYQPSVEKIAEAHKAARFAVGALAFDDVAVAVDHLRRSLELLTDPSAETH